MKEMKEMKVEAKPKRKGRYVEAKPERDEESKQNLVLSLAQRLYFERNW